MTDAIADIVADWTREVERHNAARRTIMTSAAVPLLREVFVWAPEVADYFSHANADSHVNIMGSARFIEIAMALWSPANPDRERNSSRWFKDRIRFDLRVEIRNGSNDRWHARVETDDHPIGIRSTLAGFVSEHTTAQSALQVLAEKIFTNTGTAFDPLRAMLRKP